MLRIIYTVLLSLIAPFLLWGLFRHKPGKPSVGKRWKEHFGVTPGIASTGTEVIWFHAVSVGEVIAISPLIREYAKRNPDHHLVITTTTPTGAAQAKKLADIAAHRYMPVDFNFAVRGFLAAIRPTKLIIMETELWPNTLHCVAQAKLPIIVINARLSERSYRRYRKIQPLFNLLIPKLSAVCCQHEDDAQRFVALGVPSQIINVTGSVKFDISVPQQSIEQGHTLRRQLGSKRPIWIAASTHSGEDEQLLKAHRTLVEQYPDLILLLVPRHPERFNSVENLCKISGFKVARRSQLTTLLDSDIEVFLGDTMGEMMTYLAAGDVCFVGGSLLGNKVGGHNLLEPAAVGLPILTGPSYFNFTDITQQLVTHNAAIICNDAKQIAATISRLITDPKTANMMSQASVEVVRQNQGALEKTLTKIA